MTQPTEPLMKFFDPADAGEAFYTIRAFEKLAEYIVEELPRCPERTVALRKLLESKDAALRALTEGAN